MPLLFNLALECVIGKVAPIMKNRNSQYPGTHKIVVFANDANLLGEREPGRCISRY